MNRSPNKRRPSAGFNVRWLAWLGMLGLAASAARGAQTNSPTVELGIPKSIFVSEGNVGKDPFFPNSTRPRQKMPSDTVKPAQKADLSGLLVLKGILGPPESRIALINNLTFTSGEEQEVRAGNAKAKIRVLEIRDKSVLISIEGVAQPKELLLQEKLLPFGERP